MQACDEVLLSVVWAADEEVGFRESSVAEPLRHTFRGRRHVANRICSVDLDQLLEDVMRDLAN